MVVKNTDQQLPLRKVIKLMNHNYDFETVIKFECQKMSLFTAHKLVQTFLNDFIKIESLKNDSSAAKFLFRQKTRF